MDNKIFCPKCGTPATAGTKFCASCGAQLPAAAPQPAVQQAQAAPQQQTAPQQAAPQQAAPQQAAPQAAPQQAQTPNDTYAQARQTQRANPAQAQVQPTATPAFQPVPAADGAPKAGGNWVAAHKNILIIGCAAIIVIIALIVILVNIFSYTKIEAKDLIKVNFQGINGSGTATAELNAYPSYMYLDTDDLKDALDDLDYDDAMEDFDEDDLDALGSLMGGSSSKDSKETVSKYLSINNKTLKKAYDNDDLSEIKKMRKALLKTDDKGNYKITAKVDKAKGLKNGDKVKVTIKYPESSLKDKKIKIENTTFEVKVTGLKEGTKIDPFDGIDVSFSGFDGNGSASVNSTYQDWSYAIGYDYDYSSELKNGDSYTVEAYFYYDLTKTGDTAYFKYDDEYYIIDAKDLSDDNRLTKTYTVEGLSERTEIDPFEGITFEYSGALPFVKPSYVNSESVKSELKDNVHYTVDCPDYIGEDGEFTVTCEPYYSLSDSGYALKGADSEGNVKKTFKVSELTDVPSYVTKDNAEKTHEFYKDQLDEKVKEAQEDLIGQSYSWLTSAEGKIEEATLDYSSTYVAFTKDTKYDYSTVNRIYWLYKVSFKTDEGDEAAFYYLFYTSDITSTPDGSFTDPEQIYISSTTVKNMEAFNESYVDAYKDDFTTEKAAS
ncbi:MAG: hypothetical protein IJ871_06010 [Ruminococcus sp.]|nr:hypothetical protein [Ruminococcus sp.]MBR2304675.1 hypothetical protein [Ruminococcus sp.]